MKRQIAKRLGGGVAVGLIAALLLPWAAFADDISNNLDASVDAVAEVMPLNVGGVNGTTSLYLVERNGDGKNGCNLTGGTSLGLSVISSNASVATVSPSSVTFNGCGETKSLTVTPVAQGTATISVLQTSNTTAGSFDLDPAAFTVNVAPPANTAPQIAVSGVTGGASYNKGLVPAATCQVTDAEDGPSSFTAALSAITGPYATDGIGTQTASCSYTDGGGLTAMASETYTIADPSAPLIGSTLNPAGPDGSNDWYKSNVSLTWNVSEPQSPNSLQKTDCVDQNVTADQLATTYSCSATSAGGSAGPVNVSIKRDATPPGISDSDINNMTWRNLPLSQNFTASDATSGLANSGDGSFTLTASAESANASTPTTVSKTVSDNAGNSATRTLSALIDLTPPSISDLGFDPGTLGTNGWYISAVTNEFSAADALSGLPSSFTTPFVKSSAAAEGPAVKINSGAVTDVANNTNNGIDSAAFKIDLSNPTNIQFVGGPASGTYLFGSVPAAPTCTAEDAVSGLKDCVVTGYSTAVGTHTLTATATDNAGRQATLQRSYTVNYKVCLLFDNTRPVKAGSVIPVRIQLCDAANANASASNIVVNATGIQKLSASVDGPVQDAGNANPDNNFRYDPTLGGSGGYIYNLSTKGLGTGTYKINFTAAAGAGYSVQFEVK